MDIEQAKDQIAKKYGFDNWNFYTRFWFHIKVSDANKMAAWKEVLCLITEAKDKDITELKEQLEQSENDLNEVNQANIARQDTIDELRKEKKG